MERYAGLRLGPIVGHTDAHGSRVWICVDGSLEGWELALEGRAPVPFRSTEDMPEFGTALAHVEGLAADSIFAYEVRHHGERAAAGRIRTMPEEGAVADVTFVTLSCDDDSETNAWELLELFIAEEQPRFILMVGDQIYVDEGEEDLWRTHREAPAVERRRALVQKYEKLWCRESIARIMANTPVYMTWDDHDIRDGWGSFAADSRYLAEQHPQAQPIHERYDAFFRDAADAFEHFQACLAPSAGLTGSRPFALRCGRLLVVVPDLRSQRDFARPELPVLGEEQWSFVDSVAAGIDDSVDVIAIATSVPIVDVDPAGKLHRLFRDRTDDIDKLLEGDLEAVDALLYRGDNPLSALVSTLTGFTIDPDFRIAKALGFRISDLDDVRDKWSYASNRPEQLRLIETFARAAHAGRQGRDPRRLFFLGGDIHVGAVFELEIAQPPLSAQCVITSGISKNAPLPEVVGVLVDREFEVSPDVHARLDYVVNKVNFAATRITYVDGLPRIDHRIMSLHNDTDASTDEKA